LVDNLYLTFYSRSMTSDTETAVGSFNSEPRTCPVGSPFCFGGCETHEKMGPAAAKDQIIEARRKQGIPTELKDSDHPYHTHREKGQVAVEGSMSLPEVEDGSTNQPTPPSSTS
jgi:hypothetical protein